MTIFGDARERCHAERRTRSRSELVRSRSIPTPEATAAGRDSSAPLGMTLARGLDYNYFLNSSKEIIAGRDFDGNHYSKSDVYRLFSCSPIQHIAQLMQERQSCEGLG
jgi:hypothetical protein